MICSCRGFIVNSWSSVTPRYLKVVFSAISIRLYCCVSPCLILMYHLCILPSRLKGQRDLWNCTILVLSVFISMRAFSHHSWQKCSICWSWSGLSLTKTTSSTNAIAPAQTCPVEEYVTALGNLVWSSVMSSDIKIPNKEGLSLLPSGRPRNTWVYLSSDMRGCNTLIWIFLYVSFIILHNFPCIPFRCNCLESRCLCVEGYAVEKSIKAQNVEDDLWYALFRIIASKLYNFWRTMCTALHVRTLHVSKTCSARSVSVVHAHNEQCCVRLGQLCRAPFTRVSLWKT